MKALAKWRCCWRPLHDCQSPFASCLVTSASASGCFKSCLANACALIVGLSIGRWYPCRVTERFLPAINKSIVRASACSVTDKTSITRSFCWLPLPVSQQTKPRSSDQANGLAKTRCGGLISNFNPSATNGDKPPPEPNLDGATPTIEESLRSQMAGLRRERNALETVIAENHMQLRKYRGALGKIADMLDAEDADLDDAITIATDALASTEGVEE